MKFRQAIPDELDLIYMMGFDVWSGGASEADYLSGCRSSPKYARGEWYVFENNRELLSSLIVYTFGSNVFGIGSIATLPELRCQGNASRLIEDVLKLINQKSNEAVIFLYSDVNPKFYSRFGFISLPKSLQKFSESTCMTRPIEALSKIENSVVGVPKYF